MENYIVSARKYRPATFESVVGQKSLTTTLKNAIATQKLAHAYLFCGPRGVGKTTCARIFAKAINCAHLTPEGEACNQCESCVAFNEQRSYNIHELDAASNNSVDEIRSLIEQVRIPPQIGKYKVYIIDEVHMLTPSAFNAFLKTLEEPPKHAVFILATTEKHKVLPTILSRCQIYDFNRISVNDTVEYLQYVASKEGITAEPEALNVIAQKADGGMRDALSIFDQVVSFTGGNIQYKNVIENLNVLDYEYYFKLTDCFLESKVGESMLIFNDILNKGFDGSHFISGLASHFRDLLVSKDASTLSLLEIGASIRERYQVQAQKCKPQFLYRAMKLCNDCDLNYRTSKNKKLLVEITLIQVAQLSEESDDVSHGRSPKQIIKPIFSQQDATVMQAASVSMPQATAPVAPTQAVHVNPIPTVGKETKVPTLKVGNLSISIKNPRQKAQSQAEVIAIKEQTPTTSIAENKSFDEETLNYHWKQYAASLPPEDNAMAGRMMNMSVRLLNETDFEAVVDNEAVEKYMREMVSPIQSYLRDNLHNRNIKMRVRISAPTENIKAYGRVERFQMMSDKNPVLLKLKNVFGLELS
ncbi:MAG: DNA polymerase III subunit gamma/tau [Bacteroidaceae bacterium]